MDGEEIEVRPAMASACKPQCKNEKTMQSLAYRSEEIRQSIREAKKAIFVLYFYMCARGSLRLLSRLLLYCWPLVMEIRILKQILSTPIWLLLLASLLWELCLPCEDGIPTLINTGLSPLPQIIHF